MPRSWILAVLLGSASSRSAAQAGRVPADDRARIAEATRLASELGDRIWPGLAKTPMPVLLVLDSAEFLIGSNHPDGDFTPAGRDEILGPVFRRPRRLPPTMIATFPLEGLPTIVIGSAERTGKPSTDWVLTLMHEHFHQWQYSQPDYYAGVARLDLSQGDTTGMWMLNYPFPYDSAPVAQTIARWASALRAALIQPHPRSTDLQEVVRTRDQLRRELPPADYRYLEFELWQEGVARYIEYRAAQTGAEQGAAGARFRALNDYRSYRATAARGRAGLLRELERIDVGRDRRVMVYPLGAAIALLLDETRPGWKQAYVSAPFALAHLLPDIAPSR